MERSVLNNYLIPSQKVVEAEIDWHPFPMNRKQEIGETEEEEEKKNMKKKPRIKKITWKTPNQWDKKNQKTSSTQVQGVTAAPQMMQLLHK